MGILLLGCLLEMQKKQYLILLGLSVITAIIFLIIKLLKPEIFHRELMPALQSDWFIPHVTLYMMSFLLLAISFIICMIWIFKKNDNLIQRSDDWMQAGLVLFITAMLIGSIWAEAAWGHFWTWDLKETWALITYVIYVIYLQYRTIPQYKTGIVCLWHTLAFLALQICWYGVNYLPAASESIHIYH
ncbi:MAG: cytochrome c biogenesis protein CcsA [Bacteroidales bacterium]|nr:cytochrome c biogenesis protein CcsA [Bacteroidales bacterium]